MTTKEIFEHLTAKYPGQTIRVTHVYSSEPNDDAEYYVAKVDGEFTCTNTPNTGELLEKVDITCGSTDKKIAELRSKAARYQTAADELSGKIAALEAKMKGKA
jgi:hypothetical protein